MKNAALIFLWVIHLAALIGIALGYQNFFLPKSPFTMLYLAGVLIAFYPIFSPKKLLLFISFIVVGIGVEWLGVHTGWLFGKYYYGENFGWKIDGIPYLIGVDWALLTFCTHSIARYWFKNQLWVVSFAAALMVFLDFFLEQICDFAGFWHFSNGAGWFNYLCWFIIAFILHGIAYRVKLNGDFKTSSHIYGVQLFFAIGLWVIITI